MGRVLFRDSLPDVIVDDPGRFLVDFFVELLAAEEGKVGLGVEGPVEADASTSFDLFGGEGYYVVGETIESAELIICSIETPGIVVRATLIQWEVSELGDAHYGAVEKCSGYQCVNDVQELRRIC